jgi:glycosyltransferase involved in cell wall biosynthesis
MAGGGTYRTLATANALAAQGFRVTVLTGDRAGYQGLTGVDPSLEERIDPAIEVVRVPFEAPGYNHDIRTWSRERTEAPARWLEEFNEQAKADFPDPPFGSWLKPMLAAAEEIHRRDPVDLTVGSANPHVVMAAGHHLHTHFGVPHVIDHRDAWRLHCYWGIEQHLDDPRVAELETSYMRSASRVWFVNEPIREWHQRMYPEAADKMRVVENGYDPDFAPAPRLDAGANDGRPLRFVYIGTVGVRVPVEEFIDGWIHARATVPALAGATAEVFGPLAVSHGRTELARATDVHGLHFRGPVAKADVAGVYADADVLMLLLGPGRYVTSGKVYEYLASGLPIVSLHEPGNGASDILRDYPLWFPAEDMTIHGIADALAAAAASARSATPAERAAAVAFGQGYERSLQLGDPVADLWDLVTGAEAR